MNEEPVPPSPGESLSALKTKRSPLSRRQATQAVSIIFALGLIFIFYVFCWSPPISFQADAVIKIPRGVTTSEAAQLLYEKQLIRSPGWFKILVRLRSRDGIVAGSYYFERKLSLFSIVRRVTGGRFDPAPFKVTIQEGLSNREIASLLERKLPNFSAEKFVADSKDLEGQLFPDTYFFVHRLTEQDVADTMYENFLDRIRPLDVDIKKSGRTLNEIVTMASILEEEARTPDSRRVVSGILWNRIAINMPLQVDAAFLYENGKNTYDLTKKDLRRDTPYNTYTHKGLPPGAIANPGLDSIEAAVYPSTTPYLYYLSDLSGRMYYATTYAEHMRNRSQYMYKK